MGLTFDVLIRSRVALNLAGRNRTGAVTGETERGNSIGQNSTRIKKGPASFNGEDFCLLFSLGSRIYHIHETQSDDVEKFMLYSFYSSIL